LVSLKLKLSRRLLLGRRKSHSRILLS
ncbi:hypothetical protein CFC21_099554, partial [Triticum aestivum]